MKIQNLKEQFKKLFNSIPVKSEMLLPSEFAEKYRTLTSDVSAVQGKFKYNITPYLREVVDCLHPDNPAQVIAVMKGAQIGFTEGVIVNGILWIIVYLPGNIMALSANDDLAKEMIESRLDQGITSCKIQHLIRPNTIRKRNQRTGDTSKSKEFAGGRLFSGGLQSVDKLGKQRSIRYGFFDDWDSAPVYDKKQGSIYELLQQRFSTFSKVKKEFFISTPETRPSNIEIAYLQGDQRKWNVPCPCCGEYIEFLWFEQIDKKNVGIIFDTDEKGELIENSVRYRCQKCFGEFKETEKYNLNLKGKWIPTAKPKAPGYVSYHISCLSAAPNMNDWAHYVRQWIRANGRAKDVKVFYNTVLGIPWEERTEAVKTGQLIQNTRNYKIGTVPVKMSKEHGNGEIILLTCACDLNGTVEDARLDWEVVAHCENGSTYSVNHGSIGSFKNNRKKETTKRTIMSYDPNKINNVWDVFYRDIISKEYKTDTGKNMYVSLTGVDTGYYAELAYLFIEKHKNVFGVKGDTRASYIKMGADVKMFKKSQTHPKLYVLEVNTLKDIVAENMALKWENKEGFLQPPGFMNFPIPEDNKYTARYFNEYENEKKQIETDENGEPVGWKWVRKSNTAPNHFFDVAIYNLAMRYIFVSMALKNGTWQDLVAYVKKAKGVMA